MEISKIKKVLKKEIRLSKNIYIVGHNDIDLDAFGATLGISLISKKYNKKSFIIINDNVLEKGVKKAIDQVINKFNIIKTKELKDKDLSNSLLVVVDTNKEYLVSCNDYLKSFKKVIIIDHHDTDKNTIKSEDTFIDINCSSACEIIVELLREYHIVTDSKILTIILSGIVLDTNSFIIKTTKRTFYNAYYLLDKGASTIEVQYLLKQDLKKFIDREKVLTGVKIIGGKIAIAKGVKKDIYRKEDLAKIAETLLLFDKIEASFVIGNLKNKEIGISGRSLGKINIGKIISKLNGGGNVTEGATKIINSNIKEVENKLIELLK